MMFSGCRRLSECEESGYEEPECELDPELDRAEEHDILEIWIWT
jgi:hypothetical protein